MAAKIKFCGITRSEDAAEAVRLGAWAIGLNLWPGSSRHVEPAAAAEIASGVRRKVEIAGIFVNPVLRELEEVSGAVGLTLVQLHGGEGPTFCAEAARRTGVPVIKAVRVRSKGDVEASEAFRTAYHLFDARRDGTYGGSGETFDWELLAGRHSEIPAILAGGLGPENVSDAIAIARPFAVDVTTGVEQSPGIKDHEAMTRFADAVRSVPVGQAL